MSRRLPDRSDGSLSTTRSTTRSSTAQTWTRHALAALTVGVLGVGTAGSIVLTGHAEQMSGTTAAPAPVVVAPPADTINAPVPRAFRADQTDPSDGSATVARADRADRSSVRPGLSTAAVAAAGRSTATIAALDRRAEALDRQGDSTAKTAKKLRAKEAAEKAKAEAAVLPLAKYSLAARFGQVGAWSRYHTGFDFSSSIGATVRAPLAGTVTHAGSGGPSGGWAGTYVTILHADGTSTLYAHLSAASVHAGEQVTAGQTIGRVGMSGRSFGPHLHFEVYPTGVAPEDVYDAVDPAPWLAALGLKP